MDGRFTDDTLRHMSVCASQYDSTCMKEITMKSLEQLQEEARADWGKLGSANDGVDALTAHLYRVLTSEPATEQCDWRSLSATAIAAENSSVAEYVAQLEKRLADLTANADFLRRSVGACHMMISRDSLLELTREPWESTNLPPRLFKYIMAIEDRLAKRLRPAAPDVQPFVHQEAKPVQADQSKSHLVRDGRTLCGLADWEAGNIDIKFGIESGVATCLPCLRQACLESMAVARPAILAEALERTTMDECRDPETMKYQCPINVFMEKRLRRLTPQPAPADPRVEAVIASIRSAPDIGIYAGTDLEPFVCLMLAAADRAQKEAR